MLSPQKSQPTLDSIAPRFVCQDLEQALAFYGQLGFQTTYQDEMFAIVERDGIDLHLNYSPDPPKGHSVCWIGVTNIEVLYQQYLPTHAVQSPLEAQPWGLKEFFIRDPFKNLILFAEGIPEEEASAEQEERAKKGGKALARRDSVKLIRRSYNSETDLGAVLALKPVCTTPQNIYDAPTMSDFQRLLAPETLPLTANSDSPFRWKMTQEQAQRVMTQHLTAVWEDASGTMLAYALIAQPGRSLTFQVHPQVGGQGLETAILAWGLEQMQAIAQVYHSSRDLWCRCHEVEQERRSILEATGIQPLPERDLRLVHPLDMPLLLVSLSKGFSLKRGVTPSELDAYQELHQAVFEGVGMGMDYHQSSAYQPDLDLIAVEPTGQFGAFCQCELKQVLGSQGEQLVGKVGVVGTRPELRHQRLGRALLLTGLRQMQECDATSAFLETLEPNVPAQRLFTSVGFTYLSTWQWYLKTVEPFSLPAL